MSLNGIRRLETTEAQSTADNQQAARKNVQDQITTHEGTVKDQYDHSMKELQHDQDARSTQSGLTCFFAILLGPLIGTAIGSAIGGAAAKGDKDAAGEEKKLSGLSDQVEAKSMDDFDKSRSRLDDSNKEADDVAKFQRELNDDRFTGLNA
jgi:hypothetical protein